MTPADALQRAAQWLKQEPCDDFHADRGWKSHFCEGCGASEAAHVIAALVAAIPCQECGGTHVIRVTFTSDPTSDVQMWCDKCAGGRELAAQMREQHEAER